MTIPQSLLTDGKLFIDNSRLEHFVRCARAGEYAIVRKRKPTGTDMGLKFGECIHLALQYRYQYYGTGAPDLALTYRQQQIVNRFFLNVEVPVGDHRNASYGHYLLDKYNEAYPTEEWSLLEHNGRPLVERSFATRIGSVGGIDVVWIGRVDLGIKSLDESEWVVDHKTSKVGGDFLAMDYTNSSQFKGYVYSLTHALGRRIQGAIVNVLVTRELTRTGKGVEFRRFRIKFDEDQLEEWRINTLNLISDLFYCLSRDYFPQHTSQCINKYGKCKYFDVCTLTPAARDGWLASGAFEQDTFNPLKRESNILFDEIHQLQVPSDWTFESAVKGPSTHNVNAMIEDILSMTPL